MKFKNLYIPVIVAIFAISCNDEFLSQVPDDRLTKEETFSKRSTVEQYLANAYSRIPDEMNQRYVDGGNAGPWTAFSDEAEYVWSFVASNLMNTGSWDPTSGFVNNIWGNYYKGIRQASELIHNIDQCTECTQPLIDQYKAEARALRALFYFNMMKMYGPVVILPDAPIEPDAPSEEMLFSRNSFEECAQYVLSEFQASADVLPLEPRNDDAYGRMTKPFVEAMMAEVLLFRASPLFNGNTDMASLKNEDGQQLIDQNYDPNRWKEAADAYKAFIDEYVPILFTLFRKSNETGEYDPYLSCRDVMLEDWNSEVIMARVGAAIGTRQYDMTPFHSGYPGEVRGAGGLGATQEMVDAYFMANGRPIDDAESGYLEDGFTQFRAPYDFEQRETFNQWVNREPRFYVGITYDNSLWLNRNSGDVITRLWYKGNSGLQVGAHDYCPTGYVVRKNMALGNWSSGNRTMVMLRLAEVYLNYAEALNESDPGNPDILNYLNEIRNRAGIPEYGNDGLPAPQTQEAMREAIRKERRVELAFESIRYFDAVRWKIAKEAFGGPKHGLDIAAEEIENFYNQVVFENRVYEDRHYLWPIPQYEINRNRLLVQNPGW